MANSLEDLGSSPVLWTKRPNWSSPLQGKILKSVNMLDFPGTIIEMISFADDMPYGFQGRFLFRTKQEIYEVLDFFNGRKGRAKSFWVLSHTNFFTLKTLAGNGGTFVIVHDNYFDEKYLGYERFYIEKTDGTIITRKIASVDEDEENDQLTLNLDTALDQDIAVSDVRLFGLIFLARLTQDKLSLTYHTPSVAEADLAFQELVKEYPE